MDSLVEGLLPVVKRANFENHDQVAIVIDPISGRFQRKEQLLVLVEGRGVFDRGGGPGGHVPPQIVGP